MFQNLHSDDLNYQTDPSATKQYDTEPPKVTDSDVQQICKIPESRPPRHPYVMACLLFRGYRPEG